MIYDGPGQLSPAMQGTDAPLPQGEGRVRVRPAARPGRTLTRPFGPPSPKERGVSSPMPAKRRLSEHILDAAESRRFAYLPAGAVAGAAGESVGDDAALDAAAFPAKPYRTMFSAMSAAEPGR